MNEIIHGYALDTLIHELMFVIKISTDVNIDPIPYFNLPQVSQTGHRH